MEVKFCLECGKPVQPALLSTRRQAYASCGWTENIIEQPILQKEQELKPIITVPQKKLIISSYEEILAIAFSGLIIGLLGLTLSIILLIIPIIGWILAFAIFWASFIRPPYLALRALCIKWGLIEPKDRDFKLEGKCPYCSNNLSVNLPKEKVTCGFCKERVLIKQYKFYTIIRKTYDNS